MTCSTKIDIFNHLAADSSLQSEVQKKIKRHYAPDILQDIFLYMFEKYDEEKIQELNNKNEIIYFIYGILWRQTHTKKNNTYQIYGKQYESNCELTNQELFEETNIHQIFDPKDAERIIKEVVDELEWYDKEIFNIYLYSNKSFKTLEKELNISDTSLARTVKKVKLKIKQKVEDEFNQ